MTMLQTAISELGVTEGKGAKNNPRVLKYHNVTGEWSQDSVPWCGSFIAWNAKENGIQFDKWKAARARYWITDWVTSGYGKLIKNPVPGAIGVIPRGSANSGQGHVFMFHRWVDKAAGVFEAIGGNQSSKDNTGALQDGAVTIQKFNVSDVLGWAWPVKVPLPVANQPYRKSGVIQGASATGITGGALIAANAPALAEAVQKADSASSTGTILGALAGAIIIGAAVWIIVSRINGARTERRLQQEG